MTSMVSGPVAAMILGDQGADVIKIEPIEGERMRHMREHPNDLPPSFYSCNRSKRSLALNLKDERGKSVLRKLLANTDVLIQNFRPGAIERMGFAEEVVRKIKSDIIFVSISGFGEKGPYTRQRVYDPIIQAVCGLADIQTDRETGRPKMVRTVIPDKVTSLTTAQAVTAALFHRERTGEGQHIRLSMLDAMVAFLWPEGMSSLTYVGSETDPAKGQMGQDQIYQTQDGYISAGAVSDSEWAGFCRAIERPELIEDERFRTAAARAGNTPERRAVMSSEIAKWPSSEIMTRLTAEDVPSAPVLRRQDMLSDPQIIANEILEFHDHAVVGKVRQPRPPARLDKSPMKVTRGAPLLGGETREILKEIGLTAEEINDLHADRVVLSPKQEVDDA
jgi:crotonobetainyl-CoA:carnitine CoA-transferase CaiB-like acyl-CoA transferase